MVRRASVRMAAAMAPLAIACTPLVGDYEPDLATVASAPLCAIESEVFAFAIDLESSSSRGDLAAYYRAANPDFVARLAELQARLLAGSTDRGVTYLMGAAGVGKSFLLDDTVEAFPATERCEVALGDWYGKDSSSLPYAVTPRADLAALDGDPVFNELASHDAAFGLTGLLAAAGCYVDGTLVPLIVIDGIDEIHDAAATQLLEAVDDLVLDEAADGFVHFLVAGRPEGFWSWLTAPKRTAANAEIVARFDLIAPRYETAGDLEYRLRGYLEFSGQLTELEASGELVDYISSFTDAVVGHSFLTYSTGNLSLGNVVIEQTTPGLDQSEQALKAGLFDDILQRDAETHGRPGDGEALEGAYRRALEEVAVLYAGQVDENGVFTTRSEDVVPIVADDGAALGEVRVRDLLNRSGVAFLVSATTRTTRYRFDPFWLHGHLVERYNARRYPEYEYQGCE